MGAIDDALSAAALERAASDRRAADSAAAMHRRLLPHSRSVHASVCSAVAGNRASWALPVYYCSDCPCVTIWRKDTALTVKLAEFYFSETDAGAAVHLGNRYRLMAEGGASWAAAEVIELATSSLTVTPLGMKPHEKALLYGAIALAAAPIVIPLAIGFAQVVGAILLIGGMIAIMGLIAQGN